MRSREVHRGDSSPCTSPIISTETAEPTSRVQAWLDRRSHCVTVRSSRGVEVAVGVPYGTSAVGAGALVPESDRPLLRPDGMVAERPSGWHLDHGDPMWHNYRWTAMLHPVAEFGHGVEIDDGTVTTRRGRLSWAATCRPRMGEGEDWDGGYDPRCGCPLLDSAASRLIEYGAGAELASGSLSTTYRVSSISRPASWSPSMHSTARPAGC